MEIARLKTNTPLDKILGGGIEKGAVTIVYGPAGAGKTNVALAAILGCKKAVYVDTEGSFSTERFGQMGGSRDKMKGITIIEPETWNDQHVKILELPKIVKKEKPELIVVDSMVALYRLEMSDETFRQVNRQLGEQYAVLSNLARKFDIPVLVTNQVYSKGEGEEVELTSRAIARYWGKCLVELRKGKRMAHRLAILQKHRSLPEGKDVTFEITNSGMKEIKQGLFG